MEFIVSYFIKQKIISYNLYPYIRIVSFPPDKRHFCQYLYLLVYELIEFYTVAFGFIPFNLVK